LSVTGLKFDIQERLSYVQETHPVHYVSWNLVNCCTSHANSSHLSLRSTFCNSHFLFG